MLRRLQDAGWIALFVCFVLGYGIVVWQSQKPVPYDHKQPSSSQSKSNPVGPSPTTRSAAKDNAKGHEGGHWYDTFLDHTAEWLIAIFTGTLWWSTRKLWLAGERQIKTSRQVARLQARQTRASIREAKKSAAAATETARIMRNAERPYLTPFVPELRNWAEAIEQTNPDLVMEVHLDITNIGKGVGFIESYGIAHEICGHREEATLPLIVRSGIGRMPLSAEAKFDAGAPFDAFQISAEDRLAMIEFRRTLYIYGHVRYFDFFNTFRRTGFMFEFIPVKTAPEKSVFAVSPGSGWYDIEE